MKLRRAVRSAAVLVAVSAAALVGAGSAPSFAREAPHPALPQAASSPARYAFNFPSNPAHPVAWNPTSWNVVVHSRDRGTWDELEPIAAQHGSDCGPYPATHTVSSYEDAVFLCRGHVMTAINAGGYGAIYLTPSRLLDFSGGEAVVSFRVSTLRTSQRDWIDLWVSPFEDNLELPADDWLPDLQGLPRNAVHIEMANFSEGTGFIGQVISEFELEDITSDRGTTYQSFLTPSATTRSLFELRLSRNHVRFGMPEYGQWWVDSSIPDLGWDQGVVQLGHHSYTPTKCDEGDCGPNTWHWGDFSMSSAVPFTLLRADQRVVNEDMEPQVSFPAAAPQGAHLQFAGIGYIELSFDGGSTWQEAQTQAAEFSRNGFESYWTPIPAGVSRVWFRGEDWWGGPWWVRDISIWGSAGSPARHEPAGLIADAPAAAAPDAPTAPGLQAGPPRAAPPVPARHPLARAGVVKTSQGVISWFAGLNPTLLGWGVLATLLMGGGAVIWFMARRRL